MTNRHKNPQYNLRMPESLKNQITERAYAKNQSLNSEICSRLSFTVEVEDSIPRWCDEFGIEQKSTDYEYLISMFERVAIRLNELEASGSPGTELSDRLNQKQAELNEIKQRLS